MSPPDRSFPALHIRPEHGWLNDPNGLSYLDGVYHVFFQYNPASARHGSICWGHASSVDLLNWRYEPVALTPRPGQADSFGCWSGVVTVDENLPTAVYCAVLDADGASTVLLAHSDRAMRDWEQETVPVTGMPADDRVSHLRDPFIVMVDGHRWAVQGAGLAGGVGAVLSYLCDDLHSWSYRGILFDSTDVVAAQYAPARIWECPQLVRVDGEWVVILSPVVEDHLPVPFGPVAWIRGELSSHGDVLAFEPTVGGVLDTGPAFYAPQVLALPDRILMWGWSLEHGRTEQDIDSAGWAGALTFPRELRMTDGVLTSSPVAELERLRGPVLYRGPAPTGPRPVSVDTFEVHVSASARTRVRLSLTPADVVCELLVSPGGSARLFVDASVIEVFNDGEPAHTLRAYPGPGQEWSVELIGAAAELTVWELRLPRDGR